MIIVIWTLIGAGILIGSTRLVKLRKSGSGHTLAAPGARMSAWGEFCFGILPAGFGVYFLGLKTKDGMIIWSGRCAVTSIAIVGLILVVRSYRSAHPRSGHP
jgi:hypothetical protein